MSQAALSPMTQRLVDLAKIIVNQGDIAVIYVGPHLFRARKIADMGGAKAGDDLRFIVVAHVDLREVAQGHDHGPQ